MLSRLWPGKSRTKRDADGDGATAEGPEAPSFNDGLTLRQPASTPAAVDVIFVHGLNSNPIKAFGTEFPTWIAQDFPSANVWNFAYNAPLTNWGQPGDPLADLTKFALSSLSARGIGNRPICFISHSLGGLVVKDILRQALAVGGDYRVIADQTSALVFYATPHSGSLVASLGTLLRAASINVGELTLGAEALDELNDWFLHNAARRPELTVRVLMETRKTLGTWLVDKRSANPHLPGVNPTPIPGANHFAVSKPPTKADTRYTVAHDAIARTITNTSRTNRTEQSAEPPPDPGLGNGVGRSDSRRSPRSAPDDASKTTAEFASARSRPPGTRFEPADPTAKPAGSVPRGAQDADDLSVLLDEVTSRDATLAPPVQNRHGGGENPAPQRRRRSIEEQQRAALKPFDLRMSSSSESVDFEVLVVGPQSTAGALAVPPDSAAQLRHELITRLREPAAGCRVLTRLKEAVESHQANTGRIVDLATLEYDAAKRATLLLFIPRTHDTNVELHDFLGISLLRDEEIARHSVVLLDQRHHDDRGYAAREPADLLRASGARVLWADYLNTDATWALVSFELARAKAVRSVEMVVSGGRS